VLVGSLRDDVIQSLVFFDLQPGGHCRNKLFCNDFVILSNFNNGGKVRLIRIIALKIYFLTNKYEDVCLLFSRES
jgi:hypothetical protein